MAQSQRNNANVDRYKLPISILYINYHTIHSNKCQRAVPRSKLSFQRFAVKYYIRAVRINRMHQLISIYFDNYYNYIYNYIIINLYMFRVGLPLIIRRYYSVLYKILYCWLISLLKGTQVGQ